MEAMGRNGLSPVLIILIIRKDLALFLQLALSQPVFRVQIRNSPEGACGARL